MTSYAPRDPLFEALTEMADAYQGGFIASGDGLGDERVFKQEPVVEDAPSGRCQHCAAPLDDHAEASECV